MNAINMCPMCFSEAILDSTGTSEIYGRAWQYMYITCTKNLDPHCGMDLNLNASFEELDVCEEILINAWNSIKPSKTWPKQL